MAFKKKTETGRDGEVFKFSEVGDSLTGFYVDTVEFEGEYGLSQKHIFKTDTGLRVVFGSTHLNQLLEGVAQGSLIRATFEAKKKGKKGNPMKVFTLEIDDEQSLDPSELNGDDGVNYDDDAMDEVTTAPATPAPRAAAPSGTQQERVKALLNANRKSAN